MRRRRIRRLRRLLPSRRAALALPFAAIAILGAGLAFEATPSSASSTCSLYAAPTGSDSNSGSASAPFATVQHLAAALAPGQTGCLAAGATFASDVSLSHGGQPGAPIVLTSVDPANPATIKGRVATFPGGDWITFTQVKFDGVNPTDLPSPTVGSDHVTFENVDVTNEHTAICFDLIDSTWGVAHYTTIDSSRIHDCGALPSTNQDHGIYISGYNAVVTNNYIYGNADRGVQLRGAQSATIEHNVIDGNGEGVIFGDLVTSNNNVADNIVTNSKIRWNAESFWGSGPVGTGNSFHDNCVWATNGNSYYDSAGGVGDPTGFSASANTVANPQYANAGAGNYVIPSSSPCAGKGPLTTSVGVSSTSGPPPTTPTAPVTTTGPSTSTLGTPSTTNSTPTTPATTTTTTTPSTTTASPPTPAPSSGPAPNVSVLPATHGTPAVGSVLFATAGKWSGAGSTSYSWLRCDSSGNGCVPIANAAAAAYKLTSDDRGHRIRVTVIAQNSNGSTSATSAATSIVKADHNHS